jgi:AAA+ superfamily predicted ATPase
MNVADDNYDPYRGMRIRSFDMTRISNEIMRIDPRRYVEDRAQDNFQVRGCGNPECYECNPEIASRIQSGSISPSEREAIMRAAARGPSGPGASGFSLSADGIDFVASGVVSSGSTSGPVTNAELDEARKRVSEWIIEMDGDEQSFDDIVGNEAALGQLRDAIRAPIEYAELYAAYGMKMPKGALLSGPPGCGKTMFARAAASEMKKLYGADKDVELISISGAELQSPYIGVTEGHINNIFRYAQLYKEENGHPLLVFIDEAEVLFPDRTGRVRKVAPWEESQVAAFLAGMDGMTESGAFVLLATNRPEVIDSAVLRDGRCDFKIRVERPNREALATILANAFKGSFVSSEVDEAMLTFAALESMLSHDRVIYDFHAIVSSMEEWFKSKELRIDSPHLQKLKRRAFLLEHIVSGAMAVSIPNRAKRYAFARDKVDGVPRGMTVEDVLAAVGDVFEENKALDHSYALAEFQQAIVAEVEADISSHKGGGPRI